MEFAVTLQDANGNLVDGRIGSAEACAAMAVEFVRCQLEGDGLGGSIEWERQ